MTITTTTSTIITIITTKPPAIAHLAKDGDRVVAKSDGGQDVPGDGKKGAKAQEMRAWGRQGGG